MPAIKDFVPREGYKKCKECGYEDGFHVVFLTDREAHDNMLMHLVCPGCKQEYNLGLKVSVVAGWH